MRGGGHEKIASLSETPPEGFGDFTSHPKHAWYVASFLKYKFEEIYGGWEIEKVEYKYGEKLFDVVAIKPNGRKAIVEFRTIYDSRKAEDLIEQAGRYIEVCVRDPSFEDIHFIFQVDQNNEIRQEGMEGLYRALNDFLNTGKLKLPDGTILLDTSPDESGRVLKVLTWAGGYVP